MSSGHHHGTTPAQTGSREAAAGKGHGHVHSHGHSHHGHAHPTPPAPGNMSKAFALAVSINLLFVLAETAAGIISGSMSLVADAGHNLSDVLSLILAWVASILATRPPSERYTYGLKSASILAAIANATLLWVAIGAILLETVHRLITPAPVGGKAMIIVASIGILINALSALLFMKGAKSDLNLRAAFLHLMADALVSVGVVLAGVAIMWTGIAILDPVASLLITAVIAWSSWSLLRESLRMGMLGVPDHIDSALVRSFLSDQTGVTRVHDLHIWPMSTTETALTVHLLMPGGYPGDAFLHTLAHDLEHEFGIGHSTIQIETDPEAPCALESESVI